MNEGTVKIYSSGNVPRLRYIAGLILGDILGLPWEVVTDNRKLGKHPVINYSEDNIKGAFKISPDTLLFENTIIRRHIVVERWMDMPVFFMTSSDSDFVFDIFAASFFIVSRYEEYLDYQPDEHMRFPASLSLAYQNSFLEIPVVDVWAREFAKVLLRKFQTLTFKRNEYASILTVDSDQPFASHGNNIIRSIGNLFRGIGTRQISKTGKIALLNKGGSDPFDVFDYMTSMIKKSDTDARFFFSVGDSSKYDKNPSWKNEEYRNLIKRIENKYISGIHPSYVAAGKTEKVRNEMQRLKTIIDKDLNISRFHYLRLFLPGSYRDIIKAGISEDYSMGYPDMPGFRAGIARPFRFFDILDDHITDLKIFPFMVMDETLINSLKLDPAGSKEVILRLINATRKVGGLFISIWHNTSLLDKPDYYGWREVFEFMLNKQSYDRIPQE